MADNFDVYGQREADRLVHPRLRRTSGALDWRRLTHLVVEIRTDDQSAGLLFARVGRAFLFGVQALLLDFGGAKARPEHIWDRLRRPEALRSSQAS
ncbi:hypothetical protein [Methylocella sp.]|uniref:hypothetical protein n=1 Tax=Methylocella sp. TaxID=1978226 RepID=UPI00378462A3